MFGPTFVYIFVGSPTNIYFDTKKKKINNVRIFSKIPHDIFPITLLAAPNPNL